MQDWQNLNADINMFLDHHYTEGRDGYEINKILVHHNAGNLSVEGCYNVWQTRPASAHYQVTKDGTIGQLVHDRDTAWHAGDYATNCQSIGIEHADVSNSEYYLSDETIENGAHLVAAICHAYDLGSPEWLVNVFPHSYFSSTECPAALASWQNEDYMSRAKYWYNEMANGNYGSTSNYQSSPVSEPIVPDQFVDGIWGMNTTGRMQLLLGTTFDGIISSQADSNSDNVPAAGAGWEWVSDDDAEGSQTIAALQRLLGVEDDGLIGPGTISALQAHIGVTVDGYAGSETVKALQTRMEANYI